MGGVEGVGGSKPRCREGFEIVNNRGKSKIHWGATTRVNITVDLNILRAEQHRPVPYSRKTRGKPARFPFRKKRVWSKRTTLFIATNNSTRCFDVSMFRCFDASMLRCFHVSDLPCFRRVLPSISFFFPARASFLNRKNGRFLSCSTNGIKTDSRGVFLSRKNVRE